MEASISIFNSIRLFAATSSHLNNNNKAVDPIYYKLKELKVQEEASNKIDFNNTGQNRTGQNRTGQNNTGQNRTGQNRTGQNRTGQNRTGQNRTGQNRANRTEQRSSKFSKTQHSRA